MIKVAKSALCPKGTMKNNKPSGKPSGNTIAKTRPLGFTTTTRSKNISDNISNLRRTTTVKSNPDICSSSQESLTGGITSVRRKTPVPSKAKVKETESTPIRMLNNLPSVTQNINTRKGAFKRTNQSNMRRAMSKDSVDLAVKEREKENLKILGRTKSSNCITILQLEKEKAQMKSQISDLVKNAESKKAEIATLKMENNRLKDLKNDDAVDQLRQELEGVHLENRALKERLVQLGVPLEMTTLSDNQKEQILIQRSLSGSFLNIEKSQCNSSDGPKSLDAEFGEASGMNPLLAGRSISEWERGSSSSLSELSFACLQDKIIQMEETNHCTNEELQATLQELTDLQDQLAYLHSENERITEEKGVLLESLCSQTEKLEECRTQITQLKQLLFQQRNEDEKPLSASEKENTLVDLLEKAQEAHDVLLAKQEELSSELQAAKQSIQSQTDQIILRDRVKLLESKVESIRADKRMLEAQLSEDQEQISAYQIEVSQLKLQLENEQQKVLELQREQKAGATSELNALLQETREDKEKVEEKVVSLQEQLALTQREVTRYKDQIQQLQEENMVAKNNAHKQVSDFEYQVQQLSSEKDHISQKLSALDDAYQQVMLKCQHHLEDKRELKASVGELQKAVNETTAKLNAALKEIDELKSKHKLETDEWNKFQVDLLTTVRVANDFKLEAQHDIERLMTENKQLLEKNSNLTAEIESLKKQQEAEPVPKSPLSLTNNDSVFSSVEKDLAAPRRQLTISKRSDRGAANQLSVKSLIESIENAQKHAKGPSSSCSSSSSSLSSIASDARIAANSILLSDSDLIIKPSIRSAVDSLSKDSKLSASYARLQKNSAESTSCSNGMTSDPSSVSSCKVEVDSFKAPTLHSVSILATKMDPLRRNSYGDISEKDPLASLVKGGGSKRNALLKWCQNKTIGYKGIDITNFSSSWNDGLAFCALLHSYLPNLIPYHELDNKDKKRNFTLAFKAAESVGIPSTLNINDLISQERPDWQSIMTYVTSIYKHFET